jgi:hypothetical protein
MGHPLLVKCYYGRKSNVTVFILDWLSVIKYSLQRFSKVSFLIGPALLQEELEKN